MSDITHYEGCWQDPRHHACALTEIDRLREVLQKEIVDEVTLAQAAEIERLRGLLREILPHFERGQPRLWQRIREALGDAD
jgi:hypothetical protein